MLVGIPSPSTVQVRFSGPAREVFRMSSDGAAVTIPINQITQNDTVIVLQNGWIPTQGFPGEQVEDIVPSTVRIHVEREHTKVVAVRLSTRGEIPSELALTRAMGLTPDVVRVTGPQSLVESLDTLDILPADLATLTIDGVIEAFVNMEAHADVSVVPERVSLRVPVEESLTRVLPGIPVEATRTALEGPVEVFPSSVELVLVGPRTRVGSVNPDGVRVYVPMYALQGLGPSEERRVPVMIEGIPSFVGVTMGTDSVTVRRSER